MSNSSARIGKLGSILSGTLSKDAALIALRKGTFSKEEAKLAEILIQILEAGKEICAVEIFKFSKSQDILAYFMAYLNALDYEKYQEYMR